MANRFKSSVVGYAAALQSLKRVTDQGSAAHRAAIDAMTKAVFEKSQYYCPIDTEQLKETAYWSGEFGAETYRGKAQATYVTYIVYPQYYAVYVHEVIQYYHNPPTSAKFISRSVDELWRDLNAIGAEAYRNAFYFGFSAF